MNVFLASSYTSMNYLFKIEAAVCTNYHQTSHFGIIGVVGGGGVGGNWIAEVLRVTSRSRQ